MTLSNSKYSRYDIDERLTIDAPVVIQGALKMERNCTDIVARTSACTTRSSPEAPPTQRSIFSAYWKTDERLSRSSSEKSPIWSEVEKQQRSQQRRIQKTSTYTYDRYPYQYFGIDEDESKTSTSTTDDDDSDSLNSYERVLQKNEVGVTDKNCRRSLSCTSLSCVEVGIEGMASEKTTQSDTVLFAKTSSNLRRSCLRNSRFSFDADRNSNVGMQPNEGERKGGSRTSVSFESKIRVHLFQPPVEKWAPSGWSNWFGGWH